MTQTSANSGSPNTRVVPFKTAALILSSPTRWRILAALHAEPQTSADLARAFGVTSNSTGKHLNILKDAGIVTMGRGSVYSIAPAFRPVSGSAEVHLGSCTVNLDQVR